MPKLFRIQLQASQPLIRHELFEGRDHLVVPVVMIVEGVLNGALVPTEELIASAEAWNGRPVPILHPQQGQEYVSANEPRVIERCVVGHVFAAHVEGNRLKAELWIDVHKARKLGHALVVRDLEAGKIIEVSTGYFADEEAAEGEFNGAPYAVIHRNLRPDHLALLPGETGACSIADGCGTPRVNNGANAPTEPEESAMPDETVQTEEAVTEEECVTCEQMKTLHANGSITAKQLETLEALATSIGADQAKILLDIVSGLATKTETPEETVEPEAEYMEQKPEEDESDKPSVNTAEIEAMVKKMVAHHVAEMLPALTRETSERAEIAARIKANERNTLTDDELQTTPIEMLRMLDTALRPTDYSGQGGVTVNRNASAVAPLTLSNGLLAKE